MPDKRFRKPGNHPDAVVVDEALRDEVHGDVLIPGAIKDGAVPQNSRVVSDDGLAFGYSGSVAEHESGNAKIRWRWAWR